MGGSLDYIRADDLTIFEVRLPLAPVAEKVEQEPELSAVSS
jgi:hypothetical protein